MLSLVSSALPLTAGFVHVGSMASRSTVRMQEAAVAEEPAPPPPLPKIKTMRVGDGTLAGDVIAPPP